MATGTQGPAHPSLRISRHVDRDGQDKFTSQVWSPFTGSYQPTMSVAEGVHRVTELATVIGQMWRKKHPRHGALTDVPAKVPADRSDWAEFRIAATDEQTYETRWHGRPAWARASGLIDAAETTCARVGCAPPPIKV